MIGTISEGDISKPRVLEQTAETAEKELSTTEVEERYLDLLRIKAKEIKEAIIRVNNIDWASASKVDKEAVTLELKRRIFDFLEQEQKKLEEAGMESKNSPAFSKFVEDTARWYGHLDRQNHLQIFETLGEESGYFDSKKSTTDISESVLAPTPASTPEKVEVKQEIERTPRLITRTHAFVPDKRIFLGDAFSGNLENSRSVPETGIEKAKVTEQAPNIIVVREGESFWQVTEAALNKFYGHPN